MSVTPAEPLKDASLDKEHQQIQDSANNAEVTNNSVKAELNDIQTMLAKKD